MDERSYPFEIGVDGLIYKFESVSENKTILKTVSFVRIGNTDIFNVALLYPLESGELSDKIESRNGDLPLVLATVFQIVCDFLNKFPDSAVGFRGSDARRHRLYRIAITRELANVAGKYEIYGITASLAVVVFESNVDYDHYLIKKSKPWTRLSISDETLN
ncbi:hypothetical protein J2Y45_001203 [Dyadobacter sp. BE34]|uniref:Uncharacterized protein n=1 Tax=Dyadobacter fermentans TaxID=94254 RepID=A0ABU1QTD2_9BACT|nr:MULTISPECIES: hypothetical protein [Dyadobacter]MDR6803934.1 hypothetical protein [Dyadobacter fermentans]MDR7041674.1 hypothetical protein [Dyadobacter sp. BE242]MDR7196077.1 hypothetical protein [Dyadobacter sp. BE34]MDR7213378.1 hypothetical protein [Dyadobacter sp. BE31]MDR7261483.1 hypothetical protein [Dyadobacter sp. BE32]